MNKYNYILNFLESYDQPIYPHVEIIDEDDKTWNIAAVCLHKLGNLKMLEGCFVSRSENIGYVGSDSNCKKHSWSMITIEIKQSQTSEINAIYDYINSLKK